MPALTARDSAVMSHQPIFFSFDPEDLEELTKADFQLQQTPSKSLSPPRSGPQNCQVCGKSFSNASALTKHRLTHSDERKYICTICCKAFKRQDHLNGHMLTHCNKKPYECTSDGCNKSYCDARSLRRHVENIHGQPSTEVEQLQLIQQIMQDAQAQSQAGEAARTPSKPTVAGRREAEPGDDLGSAGGRGAGLQWLVCTAPGDAARAGRPRGD
ncbi:zinc finger protein 541-like [Pollicipes pollicipes]|uniref:zinc finger protein 541-like n=1 Tax=Pollicipes pollicipes TaxID=41117 RepID=UPI001885A28B|nr:zinc finger protein 541-like [Pollicipes pollicipes]